MVTFLLAIDSQKKELPLKSCCYVTRAIAYEITTPVGTNPKICKTVEIPNPQSFYLLLIPYLHVLRAFSICKASFHRVFITSATFFDLARQSSSLKAMSSI